MTGQRSIWLGVVTSLSLMAGCANDPPIALPPAATAVPGSAPGAARGTGEYVWSAQMEKLASSLREVAQGRGVSVFQTTDQRLWLVLPGELSFAQGRSVIKPEAGALLDAVSVATRQLKRVEIRIVGHSDRAKSGSAGDALSLDRAASARDWLVMRGVPPTRFAVAGRGSRELVAAVGERGLEILIGERAPPSARTVQ